MITTRVAKPEESETIVRWMEEQYPEALDAFGPNTLTLAAENGALKMAMPVQAVLFIWGIPENPENRRRETVVSLAKLLEGVVKIAQVHQVKNVYFAATTKEIEGQAVKNGFERVTDPIYRKVL